MRLAFIVPRYGEEVLGGAETAAGSLAEHLPRSEFDVQVWTTCADDVTTWRNVQSPGSSVLNGVPVQRFPIDHRLPDRPRYRGLLTRLTHGGVLSADDEYAFVDNLPHSPALYQHIARHGAELDLLLVRGRRRYGVEFKWADAPAMTRSLHVAIEDLRLDRAWIVCPGTVRYAVHEKVEVLPLTEVPEALASLGRPGAR